MSVRRWRGALRVTYLDNDRMFMTGRSGVPTPGPSVQRRMTVCVNWARRVRVIGCYLR